MSAHNDIHRVQTKRVLLSIIVGVVLLAVFLVALDWREAERIFKEAEWQWVGVALVFTAGSYFFMSAGFAVASRVSGLSLATFDLLAVGFITYALNMLVSAGGAAGYSVRLLLLRRQEQKAANILAATILHSYLNTLAVLVLLPLGLVHLLVTHPLSGREEAGLGIVLCAAMLILVMVSAFVFVQQIRSATLTLIARLGRSIVRHDFAASSAGLDAALACGVSALRQHPARLTLLISLVIADWAATIATLGFCFDALGTRQPIGVLITGFAIGVAAGLVSMVPGGLGVQDSSMAGIYAWLGVPLEQAVLVSLLFRLVYYIVPFVVSLPFYRSLLRKPLPAES